MAGGRARTTRRGASVSGRATVAAERDRFAQMWAGVSPVPAQMGQGVGPVPAQMWQGASPVPGADVGSGERGPGVDVEGASPSPRCIQMWQGVSPVNVAGADVGGVRSPGGGAIRIPRRSSRSRVSTTGGCTHGPGAGCGSTAQCRPRINGPVPAAVQRPGAGAVASFLHRLPALASGQRRSANAGRPTPVGQRRSANADRPTIAAAAGVQHDSRRRRPRYLVLGEYCGEY